MNKPSAADMAAASRRYLGVSYDKMDCQAFVEAAMALVGINENLPGSNAWYRRMTWTGTPEECKATFGRIPVGAFLFIHAYDDGEPAKYKADGRGNASHIGIKTGDGLGAIHSSASRQCVCESKFQDKTIPNGGWNTVGLWDAFDYDGVTIGGDTSPTPTPAPTPAPSAPTVQATAIVSAENGKPVKMRAKPSKSCSTYWEIPCGATVTVRGAASGGWTPICWDGRNGYMMDEFLKACNAGMDGNGPDEEPPVEEENCWAAEIYDLNREQAEAIKRAYPMAHIYETHG